MKKLKPWLAISSPLLAAILAGFVGGWCATVTQSVSAQSVKPPRVLSLNQLNIVDADGKVRCMIVADPDPSICLLRKDGSIATSWRVAEGLSANLAFSYRNNRPGIGFGIEETGFPLATMYNDNGDARLSFGLVNKGDPSMLLYNRHKKPVAVLTTEEDESGVLYTFDAFGKHK